MKEAMTNLLKVKTIVTLLITCVFCYLAIVGKISSEQVMTIFGMVIAFYFGTQSEKKNEVTKQNITEIAHFVTEEEMND